MCVQWMHNTLSLVQQAQPQCRTYYSFADTIAMYTKTFSTCPVLVGCLCKTLTHYRHRQTSAVLSTGRPSDVSHLSEWHPV